MRVEPVRVGWTDPGMPVVGVTGGLQKRQDGARVYFNLPGTAVPGFEFHYTAQKLQPGNGGTIEFSVIADEFSRENLGPFHSETAFDAVGDFAVPLPANLPNPFFVFIYPKSGPAQFTRGYGDFYVTTNETVQVAPGGGQQPLPVTAKIAAWPEGLLVKFRNNSEGPYKRVRWEFGDLATYEADKANEVVSPQHYYDRPGTFYVTLWVYGEGDMSDFATVSVTTVMSAQPVVQPQPVQPKQPVVQPPPIQSPPKPATPQPVPVKVPPQPTPPAVPPVAVPTGMKFPIPWLLPTLPTEGPPLPRGLNILWPKKR